MGLNPQGLPGIQKITTQYIPGDVGDLCNYNNPTLNALTKELEALPPSSPKLKSVWTQIEDFVIKNSANISARSSTRSKDGRSISSPSMT